MTSSDDRLVGTRLPSITLPSTAGRPVRLDDPGLGAFVLFLYPRTGDPEHPDTPAWHALPGARGCTAESCEFRDLASQFEEAGYSIFGLSSQGTESQAESIARLHLPYPLLSDPATLLAKATGLRTFTFDAVRMYARSTLVVRDGHVRYAERGILDAVDHPSRLLGMLRAHPGASRR